MPVSRWKFTVDEYARMAEAGILGEDDRVELLEGEIVEMAPIGPPHAGCVNRLTRLLTSRLGDRAVVGVQNPIRLGSLSEPQPDLTLLRPRRDLYSEGHPEADDVLLVVEVASSTSAFDRQVKMPLYAQAGIPQATPSASRAGAGSWSTPSPTSSSPPPTSSPDPARGGPAPPSPVGQHPSPADH